MSKMFMSPLKEQIGDSYEQNIRAAKSMLLGVAKFSLVACIITAVIAYWQQATREVNQRTFDLNHVTGVYDACYSNNPYAKVVARCMREEGTIIGDILANHHEVVIRYPRYGIMNYIGRGRNETICVKKYDGAKTTGYKNTASCALN